MYEEFKCITNVIESASLKYSAEYYLATEDNSKYGIKTVMYKNSDLYSTSIFNLSLSKQKAEDLIVFLCQNHVLPHTIGDVLTDMEIAF